MNNKDFKNKLKKDAEKITPDVYSKVKKAPLNYRLFIETPEQEKKRKIVLVVVCMLFIILAVLVVALFSFIIPPSESKPSSPYVYVNVIVNNTETYGFVIDETSNTLVCSMKETVGDRHSINITNKAPEDIWEILGIQNADFVGTTAYALDYSQVDKITSAINSSLSAYCQGKGINIVHTTSNLAMNSYLATYINSFGTDQVSVTDSANTIILAYIAISATN